MKKINKKLKTKKQTHAQSAMEYLLTYGWSILIIAIALVVLFELGYFNGVNLGVPSECTAQIGFLCTTPNLNSTGNLTLTIGNNGGQDLVITGLGCSNSSAEPTTFSPVLLTLGQAQSKQVTFECQLASQTVGSSFKGSLWLKSSTGQVEQLGIASATVTTSSSISPSGNNGQGLLLIANQKGGSSKNGNIIEINANNDTLIKNIDFPGSSFEDPTFTALDSSGQFLYIVNTEGGSSNVGNILIVDTSTDQVVNSISSSSFYYPTGIAFSPNGADLYVANLEGLSLGYNAGNILIINVSSGQVVNSITSSYFAYPDGISLAPDGKSIYVANNEGGSSSSGDITIINTSTNQVTTSISSPSFDYPYDVAFTPNGNYAYVVNQGSGSYNPGNILIINTSTNQVVNSIINGSVFSNPSSISISGNYGYIANKVYLTVINTTSNKISYSVTLPSNYYDTYMNNLTVPEVYTYFYSGISISNNLAYITNPDGGSFLTGNLTVFNLQTNKTVGSVGPVNQPVNPNFVSVQGNNAYIIATYLLYSDNLLNNNAPQSINGSFSYPTSIVPYNQDLYITNINSGLHLNGNILIMNPSTYQTTGSINSSSFDSPEDIAFSGSYGYVVNEYGGFNSKGNVLVVNMQTGDVVNSINSASINNPKAITISGNYGYLANTANVLVLNLTTNTVSTGITIPGSSVYSLTTSGKYLYVPDSASSSNKLTVINTVNNQIVKNITESYLNTSKGIVVV